MRGSGRHIFWRRFPHRLTASLALLAYWTAALGLWLPIGNEKDHSQRFPCENNPCGCHSAEECWQHCCCLTAEERWAWARANGVEPPAYAERPAGDGWHTIRLCDHAEHSSHSACCERQDAVHSILSPETDADWCAKPTTCCHSGRPCSTTNSPSTPRGGVRWVHGVAALQCRGEISLWVSTGAVLPPPPVMTWTRCLLPTGWLSYPDCCLLPIPRTPPTPPPRLFCS